MHVFTLSAGQLPLFADIAAAKTARRENRAQLIMKHVTWIKSHFGKAVMEEGVKVSKKGWLTQFRLRTLY